MNRLVVTLIMLTATASHAVEKNPFVLQAPPSAGATLPYAQPSIDDALPQSFTENRSVFDMIEVVGRGQGFAILRYPMTGASGAAMTGGANVSATSSTGTSMQGISYREIVVRNGKKTFIGGRSFKVELPPQGTSVLLVDNKNSKVLWEGDLASPKVYYVDPPMTDYKYTPPPSAGTDVGQSVASGSMGVQPVMGQGAQPAGIPR